MSARPHPDLASGPIAPEPYAPSASDNRFSTGLIDTHGSGAATSVRRSRHARRVSVEVSAVARGRLAAVAASRNGPQKHGRRAEIVPASVGGCGTVEIMRRGRGVEAVSSGIRAGPSTTRPSRPPGSTPSRPSSPGRPSVGFSATCSIGLDRRPRSRHRSRQTRVPSVGFDPVGARRARRSPRRCRVSIRRRDPRSAACSHRRRHRCRWSHRTTRLVRNGRRRRQRLVLSRGHARENRSSAGPARLPANST